MYCLHILGDAGSVISQQAYILSEAMAAVHAGVRVDEPSSLGNTLPSDAGTLEEANILLSPNPPLPVIDLTPALAQVPEDHGSCEHERGDVVSALLSAAKEWGFFQVVNHGVPVELLERMASLANDFFSLPAEHKERGGAGNSHFDGYSSYTVIEGLTLRAILAEPSAERFAKRVWPDGNPAFCETALKVARELEALKDRILELLAEGLGLPRNTFTRSFEELKAAGRANSGSDVRFNYYPPLVQPSLASGALPHTDPTLMTLLYQDTADGLHVLSKDKSAWHHVEYKRGGIIVFINDVLQGWSNGVLEAGIHRAVLNRHKTRLSYLLSSNIPPDMVIEPVALPREENGDLQPCYKPFSFQEYSATLAIGYMTYSKKGDRKGMDQFFMKKQAH